MSKLEDAEERLEPLTKAKMAKKNQQIQELVRRSENADRRHCPATKPGGAEVPIGWNTCRRTRFAWRWSMHGQLSMGFRQPLMLQRGDTSHPYASLLPGSDLQIPVFKSGAELYSLPCLLLWN